MGAGVWRRFYRPVKQQITARLDADVLHWLEAEGRGYQAGLNIADVTVERSAPHPFS